MAEATPSRFEQVAASGALQPATAERLAHHFRLRANDACIRAIDDVDTAKYRTQEAARLLDEAWQRFTEERRICNQRFQRRAQAWLKKRETKCGRVAAATASSKRVLVKNVSPTDKPISRLSGRTAGPPPPVQDVVHSPFGQDSQTQHPVQNAIASPKDIQRARGDAVEPLRLVKGQNAAPLPEDKSSKLP